MKRDILIIVLFALFLLPFAAAATNVSNTEASKVALGYSCLTDKVKDKCSSLSAEEKIFSLLAVSQCKAELILDSDNEECFPKSSCSIKTTAQAILALNKAGENTGKIESWLLNQSKTPSELIWYLEIETSEPSTCKITYNGQDFATKIKDDKKLSAGAGSCLSLSEDSYWLKISPTCYDEEFSITCDKSFLTTTLYKKKTSSTYYLSDLTHSASSDGSTKEKINYLCLQQKGSCNYEGTLWAAIVLDSLGKDVSAFIPYIISMTDENSKYLPSAFLYQLKDSQEYYADLLSKQKTNYWDESGNKFYDTSLALFSLQKDNSQERENSISWLLETQDKDGCWKSSVRDTAFILYSAWPKTVSLPARSCEDMDYFCTSRTACEGTILPSYSCSGAYVCCDKEKTLKTCSELGGSVCSSGQSCSGQSIDASNIGIDEKCCYDGTCSAKSTNSNCEIAGGSCRTECLSSEQKSTDSCEVFSDSCCTTKQPGASIFSQWYIKLLIVLIILVVVGIIFRDKLRGLLFRFRFGSGSGKGSMRMEKPGPRLPPGSLSSMPIVPRRILPPSQPRRNFTPTRAKTVDKEFDDVLKKLREIGK
ncbi:MAG: hypothetical protein Q7R52_05470 [archaeon]|nr:hypothetical protein [archaeon]